MAERVATIIVLVEDLNQENLLRRYLQQLGYDNRTMRPVKSPAGRGSGEQFVRESTLHKYERLGKDSPGQKPASSP
jgi:hypothetical protein